MAKIFKTKTIKSNGNSFIHRLSIYFKKGSLKVHLILSDDKGEPHDHPWNFKSLLILPYKEKIYDSLGNNREFKYRPFNIVRRDCKTKHLVQLYRIWGIKIPAFTIGWYGKKTQLCSLCRDLGYCKSNTK